MTTQMDIYFLTFRYHLKSVYLIYSSRKWSTILIKEKAKKSKISTLNYLKFISAVYSGFPAN